jgi:hypothetical protein
MNRRLQVRLAALLVAAVAGGGTYTLLRDTQSRAEAPNQPVAEASVSPDPPGTDGSPAPMGWPDVDALLAEAARTLPSLANLSAYFPTEADELVFVDSSTSPG